MPARLVGVFLFLFCFQSFSIEQLEYHCSYSMYGAPFADVHFRVRNGKTDDFAKIVFQGRESLETITQEFCASDEVLHVWLSKESPDNNLELIIYGTDSEKGNSKLINPRIPVLKELWGRCSTSPI